VTPMGPSRVLVSDRKVSEAVARLDVTYLHPSELPSRLIASGVNPMAVISFGSGLPPRFSCPAVTFDLPLIDGPSLVEVWTSDRAVHTQEFSGCSMAMNGEMLVGLIRLDEPPGRSLDIATYTGYHEAIRRSRDLGYPYLWRAWNFFPRINDDQDGLERYRRFCVGRHQALIEALSDFPASLPAGTAVGTKSGPLQILFLAGRNPAAHLGNPRQLNAYDYPHVYGPRSPSFARATFTQSENGSLLLISGTASVVGHASRHIGLPYEQTLETVENIRAVLAHAEQILDRDLAGARQRAIYKVYVRHPESLPEIKHALQDSPLSGDRMLFLEGDLCRKELLVEIEGLIISG
jgi:chorismate lyase/3-hydroxybenzoate synthase